MAAARKPATPPWWYGDAPVPLWAAALSGVYARAIALRSGLQRRGWKRPVRIPAPVVVVGNLVAGGSGKTPLSIAVVERLLAEGFRPGVATRGYGRRDEARALWVERGSDPADAGDEPVLLARRTGVRVRADRDRVAAARALVEAGCDVIVCDDGLQHTRLARDVEIEVIDAQRRYGNGRLLPAGPLREPAERSGRCDFRVLNLGTADAETTAQVRFGEWPMATLAAQAMPLKGVRARPLAAFVGQRVHAVAGTGNPERYFAMLRQLGIAVVPHAFPDHHAYVAEDLQFGSDLPVLMTEKDAVKCQPFATDRHYCVPIEAALPEAFWVALLERIRAAAVA